MSTLFASRADASRPDASTAASAAAPAARRVLVWDAPVRVFHWLMVFSFAGAYLTAESERWRLVHVTLGYTMVGLVAFRVLWGFVGTRHARFASFVRGPAAAARYLRGLLAGKPQPGAGHNPAGALAIVALLAMTVAVTATGWATYHEVGGGWLEELHEGTANAMLALVGVHLAGVLLGSWLHRENLVGAMVSGRKRARPEDGVRSAWRSVAALMLAAVLAFWWLQWSGTGPIGASNQAAAIGQHDRDDD
jgi:cytochrome b